MEQIFLYITFHTIQRFSQKMHILREALNTFLYLSLTHQFTRLHESINSAGIRFILYNICNALQKK